MVESGGNVKPGGFFQGRRESGPAELVTRRVAGFINPVAHHEQPVPPVHGNRLHLVVTPGKERAQDETRGKDLLDRSTFFLQEKRRVAGVEVPEPPVVEELPVNQSGIARRLEEIEAASELGQDRLGRRVSSPRRVDRGAEHAGDERRRHAVAHDVTQSEGQAPVGVL